MKADHIHIDSSSIGWGCCCLQVTFQCSSFDESIDLYDQLIPLTPMFVSSIDIDKELIFISFSYV